MILQEHKCSEEAYLVPVAQTQSLFMFNTESFASCITSVGRTSETYSVSTQVSDHYFSVH